MIIFSTQTVIIYDKIIIFVKLKGWGIYNIYLVMSVLQLIYCTIKQVVDKLKTKNE